MRSRKIVTACVALVLVLVTLCGCGRVAIDAVVVEGDSLPGVMAEPLGYSYSEEEKKEIAAGGFLYDFENKPVGTVFEGEDGEVSHSDGNLIYRPKFTKYKVVNSLCGKALMFERGAESAEAKADPFIDFEFDGSIESGVDFVVEMDVMPTECNMTVQLMRLIYRPTSGVVFCAYMTYKDGELKLNDNRIATLSASELTKIACVFHQSRNAVDIYINGYMVTYGVPYSGTDVKNEKPSQIRLIQASEGTGSFTVDNVAVYKGGVPFYVSSVTDNDIELLREYRFEQADGAYTGEQGMTVSAGNSSIYIKKTPDGRKTLRYGGVSGSGNGYLQVSAAGKGSMWNYSMAVYATSEDTELSLVALIGSSLTPFLTLSGSVLTDELQGQAVCDLGIGRWNTLDLFFDETALTYDLMINGYTYAADCPISSALLSGLVGLRTGIVGADRDFSVYLDNIRLYNATGVVGYRGAYPGGIETSYKLASPDNYSAVSCPKSDVIKVTDEVKGSGANTLKINRLTETYTLSLDGCGMKKQATGDYDFTDVDALRIKVYLPEYANRSVLVILDCGTVYKDDAGKYYYDGVWKKGNDGRYTSDSYPNVKADLSNGSSGWSYYMQYINLDSEGWSTYMISTSELSSSRAPSIAHIEKITINTTGWTMADLNANATVPAEETVVYLESFEILVYG